MLKNLTPKGIKIAKIKKHLDENGISLSYEGVINIQIDGLFLNDGFGQLLRIFSKSFLGFEIDGFKISEFDKIYDNRDALLNGLDNELQKDEFFNEDFIKTHDAAKRELEHLRNIIKKLTFDFIDKCKEKNIDYKDYIAQAAEE
jgi:hypothetical protein